MDLSNDSFYKVITTTTEDVYVNISTDDSSEVTDAKEETETETETTQPTDDSDIKSNQMLADIIRKTLSVDTNRLINETYEDNVDVEKLANILHKMVSSDITIDDFVKTLQNKIDSLKPKEQYTIKVPPNIIYNRTVSLNSIGCVTITELNADNIRTIVYWVVSNTPKNVYCNIRGFIPGYEKSEDMNLTIDMYRSE